MLDTVTDIGSTSLELLGTDVNDIAEVRELAREMKESASGIRDLADEYLDDDGFQGRIKRGISSFFNDIGQDDISNQSDEINFDEAARNSVIEAVGEAVQINKNALLGKQEALANMTSTKLLENMTKELIYNRRVAMPTSLAIQRKQLEIQIKHAMIAGESLEVMKASFASMRDQLEALVNNSALPDWAKETTTELMTKVAMSRMTGDLFGVAINRSTWINNFRNSMIDKTNDMIDVISDVSDGVSGMKDMGMTPGQILFSLITDNVKDYASVMANRGLRKINNEKVQNVLDGVRSFNANKEVFFNKLADGTEKESLKLFYETMAEMTAVQDESVLGNVTIYDPEATTPLTMGIKNSIEVGIPMLLSEILYAVRDNKIIKTK